MTDPGGAYGWRAGRHMPRRRGGVLGLAALAERAEGPGRPLCVLLLPAELEQFALRERAENLLAAPGVVAVDPARMSYGAAARLPAAVGDGLAAVQARRLRLPGHPRVVVIFAPQQYPLARALIGHHPDAELWYAETAAPEAGRPREWDALAAARAALRFGTEPQPAYERNRPLWERMEALGIESGRLGSERLDVS